MSAGLQLVLAAALVAVPPNCSWAHPGANPYRGDPVRVLADFDLPEATRKKLRAAMKSPRTTDIVTITRDDIVGEHGYADLREMHSGGGRVCHGAVDRSGWSATRRERGLVYCADDTCVIVPTICNNVSLVTRRPERQAEADEGPIDIAPAAGPPTAPTDTPASVPTDAMPPGAFVLPPGGGDVVSGLPVGTGNGGGTPDVGPPDLGFPVGGGGPCCGSTPTLPVGPVGPVPPTSPVPEPASALALLASLGLLAAHARRTKGKPARTRR